MASDADDLKKRLRWGTPTKVYTRKRRKIQNNHPNTAAVTAATDAKDSIFAAPEVTTSNDGIGNDGKNDFLQPSLQTLEAEDPRFVEKSPEQRRQNQQEEAEPQSRDSSPCNLEDGKGDEPVELINPGEGQAGTCRSPEEAEPQSKDSSPRNLEDGRDNMQVELINGEEGQEGTRKSPEEVEPQSKDSSPRNLEDGRDNMQVELINGEERQEGIRRSSGEVEPQSRDSLPHNLEDGRDNMQVELINGGEEQEGTRRSPEEAELQSKDSLPRNLEDGRGNGQMELINGTEGQEGTRSSPVGLNGRDGPEEGGAPIVEPNGGEVRDGSCGGEPAVQSNRDEPTREHVEPEAANGLVKPVISRVQDRVRINVSGASSRDEVLDLRRELEGELDQIRSLFTKLEAKELQLTMHNTSPNGDINNSGRISAIPGSAVNNSYSYPQKSRSLVRVNSGVGSVVYPESRPFHPPRIAVVENGNGAADFVEKEKRTPKANQYYRNSEFLLEKDRLPPESNRKLKPNGAGRKHSGESGNGYAFGFGFGFDKHRNQVFKRCSNLLQRLMKHKHAWVFNKPVDVEALGCHDYLDIIKHPMDLGTIKTRLSQNWYKSPTEFAEDVRLVFRNAKTYNPKGHVVHGMAEELSNIFEERWTVIEAEANPDWRYQMYHDAGLPTPTSRMAPHPSPFARASVTSHVAPPTPQVRTLDRSESMTGPADFRPKPSRVAHVRIPVPKKPKANEPNKRDMTYDEKQRLSTNLQSLPSEKLDAIVQIIKKRNTNLSQHDDEIEVDIDSVDAETLWELDRFVTNYRKNLSKQRRKAELAQQARTGAARTAPAMNSAPMVAGALQKSNTGDYNISAPATNADAGRQVDNASRSSSSSSSSSDSGSSSSDSDSDSSSGYESDAGH